MDRETDHKGRPDFVRIFSGVEGVMSLEKRFYTEKEFCKLMGISRKTAFEWRGKKMISYIRTSTGVIRYRQSDIEKFERRNAVNSRAA